MFWITFLTMILWCYFHSALQCQPGGSSTNENLLAILGLFLRHRHQQLISHVCVLFVKIISRWTDSLSSEIWRTHWLQLIKALDFVLCSIEIWCWKCSCCLTLDSWKVLQTGTVYLSSSESVSLGLRLNLRPFSSNALLQFTKDGTEYSQTFHCWVKHPLLLWYILHRHFLFLCSFDYTCFWHVLPSTNNNWLINWNSWGNQCGFAALLCKENAAFSKHNWLILISEMSEWIFYKATMFFLCFPPLDAAALVNKGLSCFD